MRLSSFALGLSALTLATAITLPAAAGDEGPCGNFDFSANASCKIEVSGGCTASCDAPKVVVACEGKCTGQATQTCADTCGETCIAQCNPALLDCFKGCHDECDQPAIKLCTEKHPEEDCVKQGKAQCDQHCKSNCKVPDNSCQEHCDKCCTGSCQTQVNFDCDFGCMADVEVNCQAQCKKPTGGIFCNGQFVNASDVEACITHLASKLAIKVDVSARVTGEAGCSSGNCGAEGSGNAKVGLSNPTDGKGCASAPDSANGAFGSFALLALAVVVPAARRRLRARR